MKNGQFGQGACYDDVHHVTSEPSYQDFRHYMDDPENATARTNLHSGDVEIIEAAFGSTWASLAQLCRALSRPL